MSEKKPTTILPLQHGKVCPVCGKASYSRDGVHPQCAVQQADAPRKARLVEQKKAEANAKLRARSQK